MPREEDTGGWICNYQQWVSKGMGCSSFYALSTYIVEQSQSNPHARIFNLFCHTRGVFRAFDWPGILPRADDV